MQAQELMTPQEHKKDEYLRRRLRGFSVTMMVMGLSFGLYYLGFFGGVEGPLEAGNIGQSLAGMGVTKKHFFTFFLSIFVFAATWNHIFNFVSHNTGSRLTCKKDPLGNGHICGSRIVKREKVQDKKTGQPVTYFTCEEGHRLREAHFHPVRKGVFSHTLWLACGTFCAIVFFLI